MVDEQFAKYLVNGTPEKCIILTGARISSEALMVSENWERSGEKSILVR